MPQYQISKPPLHDDFLDEKGKMSSSWKTYFNSMHTMLANNFSTGGTQIPPVAPQDVGTNDNGVMYYNEESNTFDGFVNGELHEFTTTQK